MARIFINSRRQDSEGYVGRLYDRLVAKFQKDDIFMDVDSIKPGVDFINILEEAVSTCDIFLAVIGPQWNTIVDANGARRLELWNDFVRIEIASALKTDKLVIPVLVGQARMPSPDDLPDDLKSLARRNAIELTHQRFGVDVDKLITTIRDAMSLRDTSTQNPHSEAFLKKEAALKALRLELVGATHSPLYAFRTENRYFPVMGEGSADANIVFIGESPGKNEAQHGRPFVGPSGDVLDDMLRTIGLKREDVFITNLLLDHSPDDPKACEIAFYAPYVDRLIDIIRPGVLVPLGRFAMDYLLKKLDLPEKRSKISELHGKLINAALPYGEIHVVPLYHPAVVLYSASQKDTLKKDFEKLKLFI